MKLLSKYRYGTAVVFQLVLVVVLGCSGPRQLKTSEIGGPSPEVYNEIAFHHFSNGAILMLDRNYEAAARELEKALTHEPDSREIRLSLGKCYFSLQQMDKAIVAVDNISPKDSHVWEVLARYYERQNRHQEMFEAYRKVLELEPENINAYWYLAQREAQLGKMDEAVRMMEKVVELRPATPMVIELAKIYWQAQRQDPAIATMKKVTDGVYGSPPVEAFGLLTNYYRETGQRNEVVALLRQALIAHPHHPRMQEALVEALVDVHDFAGATAQLESFVDVNTRGPSRIRLAALYFQLQRFEEADSLFKAITITEPDFYLPYVYRGRLRIRAEQYDSAKIHLARAIEIDDEQPDAYLFWAGALSAQDSTRAALAIAREGEFVAQPKGDLQFYLGASYSRLQVYDSAIFWLHKSRHSNPASVRTRFALGAAYERFGQLDSAVAVFQAIIAVDSNHAAALNYLGYMYADQGTNLQTSLRLIERALQIDPDNGAYLDSYAWVLFKLDRIDEAEVQIRQAMQNTPQEDPVVYDHYGDILARQGFSDQAREQWTKALELDPENEAVKAKLEAEEP